MSFSPQFLDELRARVSLAGVVGRQMRLQRKGGEYSGLCPFHKEKSPSFYVVEDKGFFHCFGCGAHGDVIGFVMQTRGATFPEAVEELAKEAGLELPKASPEARERAERQVSLQEAMEAAAVFFAETLWQPAGAAARGYLERRGLDPKTIRRFRLGVAPEQRSALKTALAGRFPEDLLVEGGLLRRPEGGGETYDYFRGRVIFPIGDRAGRIIAFGGRTLGDGQPKYLNSPETPLFQKGRVLYGWAPARAAAARAPSALVTEGYMDVIALHRAGFETAVAPLGTALTEAHLEELWKLAPEPVLCFDGDAAGRRAAGRAIERALPLLTPGHSLKVALLPAGEDPDTLVLRHGPPAMQAVLDRARPLAEELWLIETEGRPLDTPERRAELERRLDAKVRTIADRTVQEHYRRFFRERLYQKWRPPARAGRQGRLQPAPFLFDGAPRGDAGVLLRRQHEIAVALMINHPDLLHDAAEDFAALEFPAGDLDRIRREILDVFSASPDLDGAVIKLHLCSTGHGRSVEELLSARVYVHAGFARPDADPDAVRRGWHDTLTWLKQLPALTAQIVAEERSLAGEMTEENWARFKALVDGRMVEEEDASGEKPI